jgi:hypothetical protein
MILSLLSYMFTNILILTSFTYFVVSTLNTIENYKLGVNTHTDTEPNRTIHYYDTKNNLSYEDTGYLDGLYYILSNHFL